MAFRYLLFIMFIATVALSPPGEIRVAPQEDGRCVSGLKFFGQCLSLEKKERHEYAKYYHYSQDRKSNYFQKSTKSGELEKSKIKDHSSN